MSHIFLIPDVNIHYVAIAKITRSKIAQKNIEILEIRIKLTFFSIIFFQNKFTLKYNHLQ